MQVLKVRLGCQGSNRSSQPLLLQPACLAPQRLGATHGRPLSAASLLGFTATSAPQRSKDRPNSPQFNFLTFDDGNPGEPYPQSSTLLAPNPPVDATTVPSYREAASTFNQRCPRRPLLIDATLAWPLRSRR